MENWSKRRKAAAVLVASAVSYGVGWFWIVVLDKPVGDIDVGPGHVIFVAFFGAVLVGVGAVAVYFGVYVVMTVLLSVWYLLLAPYRIGRWAINAGPRVVGGYAVNVAAVLIGLAALYMIGVATSQDPMAWAFVLGTIGFTSAIWGLIGALVALFGYMGLSLLVDAFNPRDNPLTDPGVLVVGTGVAVGVVFSVFAYQDDVAVVTMVNAVGSRWLVYGLAGLYGSLLFGLFRGTRWLKLQARLVPQIGDQVPKPSEEFWSTTPILAWRSWELSDTGLVGAWRTTWTQSHLKAHCKAMRHKAPDWDCRCGIYGLKELPTLSAYKMIGLVELTGTVIEHGYGYRAEEARIRMLWVDQNSISEQHRKMLSAGFDDVEMESGLPTQADLEQRQTHG